MPSGAIWVPSGCHLVSSGCHLVLPGAIWCHLGAAWCHLDAPRSSPGAPGQRPGAPRQRQNEPTRHGQLDRHQKTLKNAETQMLFFRLSHKKAKLFQRITNLTAVFAKSGVPPCLFGQTVLGGRRRGSPERVQQHPGSASAASGSALGASKQA